MMLEVDEKEQVIQIKQPFLMKVVRGKLEFIYHRSPRFFVEEQTLFQQKIERQYYPYLSNFINANVLLLELVSTYQLPWEPFELWMGETVNQQKDRIVTNTMKKATKKAYPAVSKFLTKKATRIISKEELQTQQPHPQPQPSAATRVTIPRIGRNYIALNDRFPSNKVLLYLLEDQIFNFSIVHNMKNLYLFQKFIQEDHVIFFLQEQQDQAVIK